MTDFAQQSPLYIKYDIQNYRTGQFSNFQHQRSLFSTGSTFLRTRPKVRTKRVLTKGFHQIWKKYTLQHR